mmetsp:Transcript_22061/g.29484  ORF Transcript_22061/g.29484 Transcript_22061/m.29484 type:complete len:366 (+) Transcript_22061:1107-2204(+)
MIQETVALGLSDRATKHKKAIQAEMQRREDLKNEKRRQEEEAARAKERRRERRMCLKEQKRISELTDVISLNVVPAAELKDYTVSMPIYDVRDYKLAAENGPGIFTFGGLIGEIMISLSAFYETMITRMEMPSFEMRKDQILKFLEDLLLDGMNQEACYMRVTKELLTEREMLEEDDEMQATKAAEKLATGQNIAQFGMQFLLSTDKAKMGLNDDIIRDVFYAICKINYYETQEPVLIPEDEELTDEQKERFAEQNEEIERTNELFAKMKNFAKLVNPSTEEVVAEDPEQVVNEPEAEEKCLVRVQNYRDPVSIDSEAPGLQQPANASTMSKDQHQSRVSVGGGDGDASQKLDTVSDTSSHRALK